ncbi:MAG: ActD-like protein [Nannocystaceae bacterium]|nr:ActD-like protein [Nannocystaceae bacterium]
MSDSVPDLLVEKLALGELTDAEAKAVRRRLGTETEARLEALAASDAEILEALPPSELADDVARGVRRAEARDAPATTSPSWTPWLATGGVVVAAVLLWSFTQPTASTDPGSNEDRAALDTHADADPAPSKLAMATPQGSGGDDDAIRFKGGTKLKVFRQGASGGERLSASSKVAEGDRLQVEYAAGDAQAGVIVSIDGAGSVTLHFPETEAGSPSLRGQARLPYGYELDAAPAFERFFFVTTRSEDLSVSDVMNAARRLASTDEARDGELRVPDGATQRSLLLIK